jgi:hypothetical protein
MNSISILSHHRSLIDCGSTLKCQIGGSNNWASSWAGSPQAWGKTTGPMPESLRRASSPGSGGELVVVSNDRNQVSAQTLRGKVPPLRSSLASGLSPSGGSEYLRQGFHSDDHLLMRQTSKLLTHLLQVTQIHS